MNQTFIKRACQKAAEELSWLPSTFAQDPLEAGQDILQAQVEREPISSISASALLTGMKEVAQFSGKRSPTRASALASAAMLARTERKAPSRLRHVETGRISKRQLGRNMFSRVQRSTHEESGSSSISLLSEDSLSDTESLDDQARDGRRMTPSKLRPPLNPLVPPEAPSSAARSQSSPAQMSLSQFDEDVKKLKRQAEAVGAYRSKKEAYDNAQRDIIRLRSEGQDLERQWRTADGLVVRKQQELADAIAQRTDISTLWNLKQSDLKEARNVTAPPEMGSVDMAGIEQIHAGLASLRKAWQEKDADMKLQLEEVTKMIGAAP